MKPARFIWTSDNEAARALGDTGRVMGILFGGWTFMTTDRQLEEDIVKAVEAYNARLRASTDKATTWEGPLRTCDNLYCTKYGRVHDGHCLLDER